MLYFSTHATSVIVSTDFKEELGQPVCAGDVSGVYIHMHTNRKHHLQVTVQDMMDMNVNIIIVSPMEYYCIYVAVTKYKWNNIHNT